MIKTLFVEKEYEKNSRAKQLIEGLPHSKLMIIDDYSKYFGRVKKPYLQKRDSLNAYIAKKKGTLIKEAPEAYGLSGEPHFYFIHAFNCIYECQYCYLQGHFHSPDLVFFINHEDIIDEMQREVDSRKNDIDQNSSIWFHAGEFSDSLALSHITGELPVYHDFFKNNPRAKLELRTKSTNIRELLKLSPSENIITSFSLSPQKRSIITDLKTPPTKHRIIAMKKLFDHGHKVAIHLDPVVYQDNFDTTYQELIDDIDNAIPLNQIEYISVGVVRFTKNVYHQVLKNYPQSDIHAAEMKTSFDGKVRYPRPMRLWMLQKIKQILCSKNIPSHKIYLCMEDEA